LYNTKSKLTIIKVFKMSSPTGYKIGKVSKITGISPDTLRIWERRYAAVIPTRTEAGGRLYATHEIERLKLIKTLVDNGDSISNVATLSLDELQDRLSETQSVSTPLMHHAPVRLIVVGRSIPRKIEQAPDELNDIQLISSFPDVQALNAETHLPEADILVLELSTLQQESAAQIVDLINRVNAAHAVIIYRFAAQNAVERLPDCRCSSLRAPVELKVLREHCLSLDRQQMMNAQANDSLKITGYAPSRRYDDATLAKIGAISPTISCECPHHLAELLASLVAFEQYSSECESRDLNDAELHANLGKSASHARHLIEDALEMVIRTENIQL
jgi:DNA-binding transcriptional MerR regulator